MNRGVLERAAPVQQQMMAAAGIPNWWGVNLTRQPPPQPPPPHHPHPLFGVPNTTTTTTNNNYNNNNPSNYYYDLLSHHYTPTSTNPEELPHESLSQLLLGGLVNVGDGEEEKCMVSQLLHQGNNNNSDDNEQMENNNWDRDEQRGLRGLTEVPLDIAIKQERSTVASASVVAAAKNHGYVYSNRVGTINGFNCTNNMLDFSNNNKINEPVARHNPPPYHHHHRSSSECNSTGTTGGALYKRARVQLPSSPFKVRKEKLGDRITALHQLVSPFGKTDTASVLLEAIGYIRFLQSQIEALSLPYLGTTAASATCRRRPHSVQGDRNCIFPEDPGQLLNDNCMKRKGAAQQEYGDEEMSRKDLRSRGLCLVPVSCTLQVGSDNGADYWAPAALG